MSTLYPAQQPFKFDPSQAFGDPADPFDPVLDRPRLSKQQEAFDAFMVQADRFVTLAQIQAGTVASYPPYGIPEASARFRDTTLAKDKYRIGGGLWFYKCWRQK